MGEKHLSSNYLKKWVGGRVPQQNLAGEEVEGELKIKHKVSENICISTDVTAKICLFRNSSSIDIQYSRHII